MAAGEKRLRRKETPKKTKDPRQTKSPEETRLYIEKKRKQGVCEGALREGGNQNLGKEPRKEGELHQHCQETAENRYRKHALKQISTTYKRVDCPI